MAIARVPIKAVRTGTQNMVEGTPARPIDQTARRSPRRLLGVINVPEGP